MEPTTSGLLDQRRSRSDNQAPNREVRYLPTIVLIRARLYLCTCIGRTKGCSRAFRTSICRGVRFIRTKGGTGLQQAIIPWTSLGKVSAICRSIWLGRTYLKRKTRKVHQGLVSFYLSWSFPKICLKHDEGRKKASIGILCPRLGAE